MLLSMYKRWADGEASTSRSRVSGVPGGDHLPSSWSRAGAYGMLRRTRCAPARAHLTVQQGGKRRTAFAS